MPNLLKNGHSLNSISNSVLLKYYDRPDKILDHLPF